MGEAQVLVRTERATDSPAGEEPALTLTIHVILFSLNQCAHLKRTAKTSEVCNAPQELAASS
jgi:hypothetical protein